MTTFNSFHSTNATGINPNHSLVGGVVEKPNSQSSKLVQYIGGGLFVIGLIYSGYFYFLKPTTSDSSSGSSTSQIPEKVTSQIEELNKVNIVSDKDFAKLLESLKAFQSPISQEKREEQQQKKTSELDEKQSLLKVIIYLNENQRQQLQLQ